MQLNRATYRPPPLRSVRRVLPGPIAAIIGAGGFLAFEDHFNGLPGNSNGVNQMVGSPGRGQDGTFFFGHTTGSSYTDEMPAPIWAQPQIGWFSASNLAGYRSGGQHRGAAVFGLTNVNDSQIAAVPTWDTISANSSLSDLYSVANSVVTIKARVATAAERALQYCPAPTIVSGGSSYAASSSFVINVVGGTQNSPGGDTMSITATTNSSGVVTGFSNAGPYSIWISIPDYSTVPSGTLNTTGGTGSGLTVTLPGQLTTVVKRYVGGGLHAGHCVAKNGYFEARMMVQPSPAITGIWPFFGMYNTSYLNSAGYGNQGEKDWSEIPQGTTTNTSTHNQVNMHSYLTGSRVSPAGLDPTIPDVTANWVIIGGKVIGPNAIQTYTATSEAGPRTPQGTLTYYSDFSDWAALILQMALGNGTAWTGNTMTSTTPVSLLFDWVRVYGVSHAALF